MTDKQAKEAQEFEVEDAQKAWNNFTVAAKKSLTTPKPSKMSPQPNGGHKQND